MQKHTHGIEAQTLSQSKLPINQLRVKRLRLKHLQLVNGRTGHVVATHQPWLISGPGIRPFRCPAPWRVSNLLRVCTNGVLTDCDRQQYDSQPTPPSSHQPTAGWLVCGTKHGSSFARSLFQFRSAIRNDNGFRPHAYRTDAPRFRDRSLAREQPCGRLQYS